MPEMGEDSWIERLQAGDEPAAQHLWNAYYTRLVGLARKKLGELPRRDADEEDIALSAFASFCCGAAAGRFPQLADRDDLWRVLVVITARKVADRLAHQTRQRRGGGKVRGESAFGDPTEDARGIEYVIGRDPTPEFAAQVAEDCEQLLRSLPQASLRQVALGKLHGHTNQEIADLLDCSLATVERKLALIREVWSHAR